MKLKKIGLGLAATMVLVWISVRQASKPSPGAVSTVAASSPAQAPGGQWRVSEDRSPMDDSQTVALSLDSGDVIQGPLGSSRPTLVIRCKESKTDVYVITGSAASVEQDVDGGPADYHTVRIRLDQNSLQTEMWYASTDENALFTGDADEMLRELRGAQTLAFEFTPFQSSPAVARFDLSGLAAQLSKAADACGWGPD
jgi:hypothetical protein